MNSGDAAYHIKKIKDVLKSRRKRNPGYSLRSYARDLGLSPSALSDILNGKKGISKRNAEAIAQRIGLDRLEQKVFVLSVISRHGRSAQIRGEAEDRLHHAVEKQSSTYLFANEALVNLESWHDFAVLEALELSSCKHTTKWFARRLDLTEKQVERAIKRLESHGKIIFEDGRYRSLFIESTTESDIPCDAIKEYHSDLLTSARAALYKQPVSQREFLNMTMAFRQEHLQEVKDFIRNFQEQFGEKFYSKDEIKDSVYQLSVQFFRLDQGD